MTEPIKAATDEQVENLKGLLPDVFETADREEQYSQDRKWIFSLIARIEQDKAEVERIQGEYNKLCEEIKHVEGYRE